MKPLGVFVATTIATSVTFLAPLIVTLDASIARAIDETSAAANNTTDGRDIRTLAPARAIETRSPIAAPRSGTDLGSVSADWAQREVHLLTGGADERLIEQANERLDRLFTPSEISGSADDTANVASRTPSSATSAPWMKPRSLHVTRMGEFEFGFDIGSTGRAKLSCDLVGANGAEWNLSKPVSNDIDLRLHHETNVNSLQLRLNW